MLGLVVKHGLGGKLNHLGSTKGPAYLFQCSGTLVN